VYLINVRIYKSKADFLIEVGFTFLIVTDAKTGNNKSELISSILHPYMPLGPAARSRNSYCY
jgi:hypothetical protein